MLYSVFYFLNNEFEHHWIHLCFRQSIQNHLNKFLQELLKNGAEGVIIKNPNLSYETGRTNNSLKVKEFLDDEGKVIGHNFNKDGSFKSLKIELKNKTVFNLGGGFKKEDRRTQHQ